MECKVCGRSCKCRPTDYCGCDDICPGCAVVDVDQGEKTTRVQVPADMRPRTNPFPDTIDLHDYSMTSDLQYELKRRAQRFRLVPDEPIPERRFNWWWVVLGCVLGALFGLAVARAAHAGEVDCDKVYCSPTVEPSEMAPIRPRPRHVSTSSREFLKRSSAPPMCSAQFARAWKAGTAVSTPPYPCVLQGDTQRYLCDRTGCGEYVQ